VAFLSPLFLIGAAAAIVPLVLHLFKRQTARSVRFSAVALLKGAPVEHAARHRLRDLLLLALRVCALVLLALAFARPYFRAAVATYGGLTVVAIDTSLSMSAPAQVARARQLARDAVRNAPSGDDIAIVTFADRAEVVVSPTPDRAVAASAVDAVAPGYGSTRYRAGLAAAGQLFRGRAGTIVLVSDLQANGWDAGEHAAVPESVRVDVIDVVRDVVKDGGAPAENLAVVDLRADGDRLVATIRNSGVRERDVRARLTVDGRAAGVSVTRVGANETAQVSFAGGPSTSLRAGSVAHVQIDDRDGLQGDNARYALIASPASASTLLVTTTGDVDKDAWYVHQALLAGRSAGRVREVTGVSASQLGTWTESRLAQCSVVMLVSTRGLERHGREHLAAYVNAGGGLFIAAGPDVDSDLVAGVLGAGAPLEIKSPTSMAAATAEGRAQALAPADVRHPIFRSFGADIASLSLVRFHSAAHVGGPSCQTLATFTSGDAAMLDCAAGGGRAIVVASDLNNRWNDFPIRASFVPFLDQAVRYLSSGDNRGTEYLVGDVPPGVPAVPGVATLTSSSGARRVVVNVDPRESDIDRMAVADFQASITRLKDVASQDARADVASQESHQRLWQYVLATMIIALAVEGVVAA
jgi:hypothetical protein